MRIFAFLAIFLLSTGIARADRFEFLEEGFEIDGPRGWVVLSIADMRYIHRDADFGSEEVNRRILSQDPTHMLSIVATRNGVGVVPGLHLYYRSGQLIDTDAHLNQLLDYLRQNANEFQRLSDPRKTKLGRFDAGVTSYRYTATTGGRKLIVEEKVWVVPMGRNYLTLSSGTAPEDEIGKRQILEAVRSLRAIN